VQTTKRGPRTALPQSVELKLTKYVFWMQDANLVITSGMLLQTASAMHMKMRGGGRGEQPLKKEWRRKFLKRHPEIVFRKTMRLNAARQTTTNDAVNGFYENLEKLSQEHNITADTLWNTDETGIFMHPGSGCVRYPQRQPWRETRYGHCHLREKCIWQVLVPHDHL